MRKGNQGNKEIRKTRKLKIGTMGNWKKWILGKREIEIGEKKFLHPHWQLLTQAKVPKCHTLVKLEKSRFWLPRSLMR